MSSTFYANYFIIWKDMWTQGIKWRPHFVLNTLFSEKCIIRQCDMHQHLLLNTLQSDSGIVPSGKLGLLPSKETSSSSRLPNLCSTSWPGRLCAEFMTENTRSFHSPTPSQSPPLSSSPSRCCVGSAESVADRRLYYISAEDFSIQHITLREDSWGCWGMGSGGGGGDNSDRDFNKLPLDPESTTITIQPHLLFKKIIN